MTQGSASSPDLVTYEVDFEADPSSLIYTFGGVEAKVSLNTPSVLVTSSQDCFAGAIHSEHDLVSHVCDPRYLNPQTGPFFINGANPGDTLCVHFVSIEPHFTHGFSTTVPFFGALTSTGFTATLQQALPEMTWRYGIDFDERSVRYEAKDSNFKVDLPLDPMHGTVGVAPPLGEVRSSLTPGDWGGNMDTPEMRSGVTCYLGVNVEGALFSFGDGHARQGEGETCGVAVETAMDTTLILDVIDGYPTPWPRLESDEFIMTTGSARPLEDAFRIAHTQMVHWIAELTGLSTMDSYQLVSQVALTPIANVVDTNYTVVAKVPKSALKGAVVMGGAHQRLRTMATRVR